MNKRAAAIAVIAKHMRKQAAIGTDIAVGSIPSALLGSIAAPFNLGGEIHGLATKSPSIEDIQKLDATTANNLMPGVTPSRIIRRRKALRKLLKDNPSLDSGSWWRENLTGVGNLGASTLLGAALGTGVGVGTGARYPEDTMAGGAALGAGVSAAGKLIGSLAALCTRRRTLAEQAAYENDKSRKWKQLLIPGLAEYDMFKSMGATRTLSDRSPEELRNKINQIKEDRGVEPLDEEDSKPKKERDYF